MSIRTLRISPLRLAASLGLVALLTVLFAKLLVVNATTVGFVYLIAVLLLATVWGLGEAVVASVASMLAYNYFFLPPMGRFTIADPQNWIALVTFLATALVASHLSDRAQRQAADARMRQQETEQLYALSRAILLTDTSRPIGLQAAQHIAQIFDSDAVVLFDAKGGQQFQGGTSELGSIEQELQQVVRQGNHWRDETAAIDIWPISLGGNPIGALAVRGITISDGAVQALLNLVAIALERVRTEEATSRAEIARQSEEFKSTLLDAIAHEFKTPLTSIKAAATSLLSEADALSADRRELLTIVDEETDRLSLLVTEAVQMSQIDAGKVRLERVLVSPEELVTKVVAGFGARAEGRFELGRPDEPVPQMLADPDLIGMALRQVMDNALKYAPSEKPIRVALETNVGRVEISVQDWGPGIPERDRERVFDKFYRRQTTRDSVPGSGLGLHIAREIARTHGGDLQVEAAPAGGALFRLSLPAATEKPR